MPWFWFIHFHIDGLNVTPHHRERCTKNSSKTKKVKEDFKVDVLKHKQEESVSIEQEKKELEKKIKLVDKQIETRFRSGSSLK